MKNKAILVLGGYGVAGSVISRLLLKETDVNIIIAGRRKEKAEELSEQLNKEFPGNRVSGRYANASDLKSLMKAFREADFVLVSTTTAEHAKQVAQAALDAGIDYLDIHFQQNIVPILNELAPSIEKGSRCFITQAGFHPGLPAVFVRRAASYFSRYRKAVTGIALKAQIEKPASVYELIEEIREHRADIFKDGKWKRADYRDVIKIDFGSQFGICSCHPIQLEEIRPLPQMFGLEEVGVYEAGYNWFVDNIVIPLIIIFNKIRKGWGMSFLARLFVWGLNTFSGSQGVVCVLEAEGEREGKPVKVRIIARHEDPYDFTAIAVVACMLQYLDDSIVKPGLRMMGHIVDPTRFLNDMDRMGVKIRTQVTNGNGGGQTSSE